MNVESQNIDTLNSNNIWVLKTQNFSDTNNHLINIDELLSNPDRYQKPINNIEATSEWSNSWMHKVKTIWILAGILLLTVVSGVFIYMIYPIEFQNIWKTIQWNVLTVNSWSIINTWNNNIDNKNNLTQVNLDSWSKNQIDNLFAWKWLSGEDKQQKEIIWNNTDNNISPDDPNKLTQNTDWSPWLTQDSNILEWLNTGGNYGNGDEDSKIKLLSQIRAKIEIAKINYTDAKKSQNIESMKLIAPSLWKYKKLLNQVENNEINTTSEIQDKLVEIQADMDKAKILIQ